MAGTDCGEPGGCRFSLTAKPEARKDGIGGSACLGLAVEIEALEALAVEIGQPAR